MKKMSFQTIKNILKKGLGRKQPMKEMIQIVIIFDPNNGKMSLQAPLNSQDQKNDVQIALANAMIQAVAFNPSNLIDPKRVPGAPKNFKPNVA